VDLQGSFVNIHGASLSIQGSLLWIYRAVGVTIGSCVTRQGSRVHT